MTGFSGQKQLIPETKERLGEHSSDDGTMVRSVDPTLQSQTVGQPRALETSALEQNADGLELESSPHLENILGKISAIMAETSPDPAAALKGAEMPDQGQDGGAADGAAAKPDDKFVAREPLDLLAPYSDVLNDVRDYFRDKHSLDPNDRLMKSLDTPKGEHRSEGMMLEGDGQARAQARRYDFGQQGDGGAEQRSSDGGVFSPIEFNQPLTLPASESEVFAPESQELQGFRRELMSRMSQLEQVIGHHFGDQQTVAQNAAKAAVELTLENLPQTVIGQRLDALEAALKHLQQSQSQTQKPALPPEKLKQMIDHLEPQDLAGDDLVSLRGDALASGVGADVAGAKGAFEGDTSIPQHPPVVPPIEMGQTGEIRQTGQMQGVGALHEMQMPNRQGGNGHEQEVGLQMGGAPEGQAIETEGSMDQLREMFKSEADKRSFGKQSVDGPAGDGLSALGEDPVLSKSMSLRAQFNRAKIIQNDDEISSGQRRGAKPALIIISLALLSAAVGLAFENKSFNVFEGMRDLFSKQLVAPVGKEGKNDQPLGNKDEGEKALDGDVGQKFGVGEDELSITGNIMRRGGGVFDQKNSQRLSENDEGAVKDLSINPESLLPEVADKLTLPPALIGPYSLRHAAANGDVASQFEVARRYGIGQGVKRDYDRAVFWYMQAAAKGFAPAQYRLATFYERGRGVVRSLKRAQIWYKRAAEHGNVKAMHNLAVVSTALHRDRPDYQTAIYWFKQAASRNLADSQFNLAILYQNGVGVPVNLVEAYRWFSLAARQGDLGAATRREAIEKKLKKRELLMAHNMLQTWKAIPVNAKANVVGLKGAHVTSTMTHASETVKRSRVLTAQILLRRLGYKLKEADGALNEPTVSAIKKFEKAKGLPITGEVTSDLIKILNKAAL